MYIREGLYKGGYNRRREKSPRKGLERESKNASKNVSERMYLVTVGLTP